LKIQEKNLESCKTKGGSEIYGSGYRDGTGQPLQGFLYFSFHSKTQDLEMGRNHSACDRCKAKSYDFDVFDIENYGMYYVCEECTDEVASLLKVVSQPEYHLFLEHRTSRTREIFENLEDMKKRLANLNPEDFIVGIHKGSWEERLKRSFLRRADCGLTEKEIENSINKILKEAPRTIVYVGWLGGQGFQFGPEGTTEQLIKLIENEKERLGTGNKPILIGDEYGVTGYNEEDVAEFRCMRWSNRFETYDNLGELEEALKYPQRRSRIEDIIWGPTHEFLEEQIKKNKQKIQELDRKRKSLEDLQDAIKKTRN
jgi:hypothetical protein